MTEEDEKPEEEQPKPKPAEETTPLLDKGIATAERLEDDIKRIEELQDAQKVRDMKMALGGRSEAGGQAPKEEETPEEYARKVQAGEVPYAK